MGPPFNANQALRKRAFLVDAGANCTYLHGVMLRQLLTLLALITGLAAAETSAQARIAGVSDAQIAVSSQLTAPLKAHSLTIMENAGEIPRLPMAAPRVNAAALITRPVLTVRIAVDRAHE